MMTKKTRLEDALVFPFLPLVLPRATQSFYAMLCNIFFPPNMMHSSLMCVRRKMVIHFITAFSFSCYFLNSRNDRSDSLLERGELTTTMATATAVLFSDGDREEWSVNQRTD